MRLVVPGPLIKFSQAQVAAGERELKLSSVHRGSIGVAALCRHLKTVGRFGAEPDLDRVGHSAEALSIDVNFAGHLLTDAAAGQP